MHDVQVQTNSKDFEEKRFKDSVVFNALVQLYRHKKHATSLLMSVRLNPDFKDATGSKSTRADLEFFIP